MEIKKANNFGERRLPVYVEYTTIHYVLNKIQSLTFIMFVLFLTGINQLNAKVLKAKIKTFPAPNGEPLSSKFKVLVNKYHVDIYPVKVAAENNIERFKAVDDLLHSADYFDEAAFCYFGLEGSAIVKVEIKDFIREVKVLPSSRHIPVKLSGHFCSFPVDGPQNLTLEINGDQVHSLHIFINQIEKNPPAHSGPDLIYFGPGIHYVSNLVVGNNKTVYIAGGAVIRAIIDENEHFNTEPSGLRNYEPTFLLSGNHIRFTGSGIIDATACTTHARSMVEIRGRDIKLEGVILKNPSVWTAPVKESDRVEVNDIKILGYRANSDGIDICNSNNVTVKNCFIRTNDDLIVLKTFAGQGTMKHVLVENCVLWNQLAHGLSLGAELHEDVSDVLFSNCDIIHDKGREWSLRVFQAEGGAISNVRFENINVEETRHFISAWIGQIGASTDKKLGIITGLTFKNINAITPGASLEIIGGDDQHPITNVNFIHVQLNGKLISIHDIRVNPFVKNLYVKD